MASEALIVDLNLSQTNRGQVFFQDFDSQKDGKAFKLHCFAKFTKIKSMNGILVVNKPAGMTSFDVIAKLRKQYKQKKFGHAGTLDPMASGVLVILAGSATKVLPFLSDTDKEYLASIALGAKYDTDDIFGTVEETKEVNLDFDFEATLQSFVGKQHQKVPKASAKKINGKKMYDYLRDGQDVPDVYSDIEIYQMEPVDAKDLSFKVACSSGTYVRSICRDFGEKTGNLAAMKSLVRTKANGFTLEQAQAVDAFEHTIYSIERVLTLPKIQAPDPAEIKNGKTIALDTPEDRVLVMDGDEVLAVYDRKKQGSKWFGCTRGLWS